MREPEFLAVLTGVGEAAYRRADGVLVIPLRAGRVAAPGAMAASGAAAACVGAR